MNKRKFAVGPGAASLILIAVVLALSVLTVLTMIAARSDEAMAIRSLETRREVYGLYAAGERSLAGLDAALASALKEHSGSTEEYLAAVREKLPEGMQMKEDRVSWTEKTENRVLECEVRILEPGADRRTVWTLHRLDAGEIWEDEGFDEWDSGEEDFGEEASEEELPETTEEASSEDGTTAETEGEVSE